MDRNTIVGFSLIFLILVGYYWWTAPTEAQQARQRQVADSIALVEKEKTKAVTTTTAQDSVLKIAASKPDSSLLNKAIGGFSKNANGTVKVVELKNKSLTVSISNKGGRIIGVRLNDYKRSDSTPLNLFDEKHSSFYYELQTRNAQSNSEGTLRTDELFWEPIAVSSNKVIMRLTNGNGGYMDQIYTLNNQNFLVDYKLELHGIQNDVFKGNPDLKLTWQVTLPKQEKELKWESQNSYPAYKISDESPENLSASSPEEKKITARPLWISFKQQYFNSTIISKDAIDKESVVSWKETKEKDMVKDMKAEMWLDYALEDKKTYNMSFYFGPNHFNTLKALNLGNVDHELQSIVPTGWGIFGVVNRWLVIPIFNFLADNVKGISMGLIILLLTLIIKSILLPLVYKSYISTAKMRILKPELDVIKEKHNGDMQKMQVENMALYKKAGVSPMSGCIPVVLQMPILFALFQFFPNAFELRQQTFLWSHDLSQYDSVLNLGFSIPFYGNHVSLFTLLMTISTLIYTRLNNQISGVTGQMKWIGYFMPIIFLGVLNDYASGLTWYYFVSNMVTFAQQAIIRRTVDDKKLHAQIAEARKKPVKQSAFQARLQEAMKQAQTKKPITPPKKGGKK